MGRPLMFHHRPDLRPYNILIYQSNNAALLVINITMMKSRLCGKTTGLDETSSSCDVDSCEMTTATGNPRVLVTDEEQTYFNNRHVFNSKLILRE